MVANGPTTDSRPPDSARIHPNITTALALNTSLMAWVPKIFIAPDCVRRSPGRASAPFF
jgi:hypothetical protein